MKLAIASFRVRSTTGDENLNLRVFQGTPRFSINDKANKLLFDRPLTGDRWTMVKKLLDKARACTTPDTTFNLVFSKYNPDDKKVEHDWNFCIVRNDKLVYEITISWENFRLTFPLRGLMNISVGSEPMSDADRSVMALETMINHAKELIPVQMVMSNSKEYWANIRSQYDSGNRGGGSGGNRQYASGRNYSSQPKAQATTNTDSQASADQNFF